MTYQLNFVSARLAAAILFAGSFSSHATETETVFHDARRYTVQIRSATPIPTYEGEKRGSGLGAGFVVDASRGWIVTNAHVAGRSPSRIKVAFYEREFVAARKVYVDPFLDLAVIEVGEEIRGALATEASLDCGGHPQVGHPVGAFGHPNSFKFSGTRGIVSGASAETDTEMLQIDAPINPGNSGGPLISLLEGRVVGINTEIKKDSQNTNFALPIPYVCRVVELLKEGKNPSPPALPFEFFADPGNKPNLRVARSYAKADEPLVKVGDEVIGVAGFSGRLVNETQLINALRGNLGKVRLTVLRDGHELELAGRLSPQPLILGHRSLLASGVLFGTPPHELNSPEISFPPVFISYVEGGSQGEFERIERHSFVVSADEKPVATLEDLFVILNQCAEENRAARLTLTRISSKRRFFDYLERSLTVSGLKWVSEESVALAKTVKE